ncbi:hypothetical protein TPL01_27720 [Sulfuriferula plumbiphila]|uniref:Uncharacterized protein n=1 Tax=Sulfuriferula plumbiphila TaxID=171865 RepID=A0A512LAX4_9PROT|nr:hypothetical protein SFPGR_13660 [Sulfuriferula plumbiphila]GEP31634.1 hypothetical protein TPL01_27720 [Sulfuriferula plumbiphila]
MTIWFASQNPPAFTNPANLQSPAGQLDPRNAWACGRVAHRYSTVDKCTTANTNALAATAHPKQLKTIWDSVGTVTGNK